MKLRWFAILSLVFLQSCGGGSPGTDPAGTTGGPTGSASVTRYQGWIEELKAMHPGVPLLITETGLSVSPNAAHLGPPNYGYGGNTVTEQAAGILQHLADIQDASVSVRA